MFQFIGSDKRFISFPLRATFGNEHVQPAASASLFFLLILLLLFTDGFMGDSFISSPPAAKGGVRAVSTEHKPIFYFIINI